MSDQPVRYLTLDGWTHLCAEVLGVELATITFTADQHLADSALHAPQASFGEDELDAGGLATWLRAHASWPT